MKQASSKIWQTKMYFSCCLILSGFIPTFVRDNKNYSPEYNTKVKNNMKIILLVVGKTNDEYINKLIDNYIQRLKHYTDFEWQTIAELKNTKNMPEGTQKEKEGEAILKATENADEIFLLDEHGDQPTSVEFSGLISKYMNKGTRKLVFVIGGPYGFSEAVYKKITKKISLSKMTFSHQMVRLIFVEQLYRAFTIIKGESYHHK